MNELLSAVIAELDVEKNLEYTRWLTENAPKRISGMGDDRIAAEYFHKKFTEFGLESEILEYDSFNSRPICSEVTILEPEHTVINSLPCCHIASTPDSGLDLDLVYLGAGAEGDYDGKDVRGKAVMVEVSLSPGTPEKARIAAKNGRGRARLHELGGRHGRRWRLHL